MILVPTKRVPLNINAVDMSDDGSLIASGDKNRVEVWCLNKKYFCLAYRIFTPNKKAVTFVKFSKDKNTLFCIMQNNIMILKFNDNVVEMFVIERSDKSWISSLAPSEDGKDMVVGFVGNRLETWAEKNNKWVRIKELMTKKKDLLFSVALNINGTCCIYMVKYNGEVTIIHGFPLSYKKNL